MTRFKLKAQFASSTVSWVALGLILFLLPAAALPVPIQAYQAKVIGIADGDTVTVLQGTTQIKIRPYGIDCPERRQAFGSRAKEFASEMVFSRQVKSRSC